MLKYIVKKLSAKTVTHNLDCLFVERDGTLYALQRTH